MDVLTIVLFVLGLVLLVGGAELLVRGASQLAVAMRISPLVIGLTIVAYGTSAPEMAVSVQSALSGQGDLAVGNVVGSNIFNVLFILGLSASIAPLIVSRQLIRTDVPVMIGVSLLFFLMALDGRIDRLDGLLLVGGAIGYTTYSLIQSRRETTAEEKTSETRVFWPLQIALVLIGLAMLVIGSGWLVDGAVAFAEALGVSELIIGLTIVAAGTSLPELATSVLASIRGERDIAVGNVVGSNIFNILSIIGVTAVVSGSAVPVAPAALAFDLPVMLGVAIACLPIFFTGYVIARWEGLLFVGYYIAYTLYLMLNSTGHAALSLFNTVMLIFVLPLTAVTLIVLTVRAWRTHTTTGSLHA
ncbi:MAG: calcium/sodium antiporter [Chloroflexaceae bacterium]|nr:calcium/sodium antiporter [Chloroflexaceae bacterium]